MNILKYELNNLQHLNNGHLKVVTLMILCLIVLFMTLFKCQIMEQIIFECHSYNILLDAGYCGVIAQR